MQKGTISKAGIAQLVERFTRNEDVGGSIPLSGTIFLFSILPLAKH